MLGASPLFISWPNTCIPVHFLSLSQVKRASCRYVRFWCTASSLLFAVNLGCWVSWCSIGRWPPLPSGSTGTRLAQASSYPFLPRTQFLRAASLRLTTQMYVDKPWGEEATDFLCSLKTNGCNVLVWFRGESSYQVDLVLYLPLNISLWKSLCVFSVTLLLFLLQQVIVKIPFEGGRQMFESSWKLSGVSAHALHCTLSQVHTAFAWVAICPWVEMVSATSCLCWC